MIAGSVAVLVTDSGEALRAARYGARLARSWRRPLLLVVPLPPGGPDTDPTVDGPAARWRDRAAADLLLPVLSDRMLHGVPVHLRVVASRGRPPRVRALGAALDAARRARADVLVVGPRAAGTGPGRGVVLLDPETGLAADGQPPQEPVVGQGAR